MRKLKNIIITLAIAFVIFPLTANAASANIGIKTSGKAVVGGQITATVTVSSGSPMGSWQFLVSYDSSKLKLTSGTTSVADYTTSASGVKSKSYTLKFTALSSGNASINVGSYLVYAIDESQMSVSPSNASVKIITQAELEASYSKDNNLKGLSIEGYELTPAFDKDTLEYSVTVPSTINSVNINAVKNDSSASVEGAGEHSVIEGSNPFEIVVTAQNGSSKTYKLNVIVEDIKPIEVNIGNDKYTVVKRADNLEKPTGFEETTVTINELEIPAFKSEILGLTLVGIKDESGNISLAIYDNGKYSLYNELTSNNNTIYLLDLKKLDGFIKTTIKINNIDVEVYKFDKNSKYSLVYGKNVESGEESWYMYDAKENTFQRYNTEQIDSLNKTIENYLYVIYALAGCFGLIALCFIINCIGKKKAKNKRKKQMKLEESNNENKEIIENLLEEKKNKKNKKDVSK